MGLFSSKTSVNNVSNVDVTVAAQIENTIINDDSRLQAMVDKLAEGNTIDRSVALATAQSQVEIAKAEASQTDKLIEMVKAAIITAAVGFAFNQLAKR
jgi:uncharacterized protein YaiL (DUF2058 family)